MGKAIGIDERLIDEFAKDHYWFDETVLGEQLRRRPGALGVQEDELKLMHWIEMTQRLKGFPRHLSQHVGGFVLTHTKLTRLVPVEKASMKDRSVIQWEKDDLEAMGMLKVDVLALGMLSAIRRGLAHMNRWRGSMLEMHQIPSDDPKVFDMICDADTIGVFQIESRAQMSMLPRLKPRTYEDLVIEVAIVRPGPIQGGMVHPYLKQRERVRKRLPIHYEQEELRPALERTLGVPIFQEQVMQIAMIAANFTAGEADQLRRAMAAWKRKGGLGKFHDKLVESHGQERLPGGASPRRIFKQIQGFGEYGFPESHAASFALLAYGEQLAQAPRARLLSRRVARFATDGLLQPVAAGAGCTCAMASRCARSTSRAANFDTTLEARDPDALRFSRHRSTLHRPPRQREPACGAAGPEPHIEPQQGGAPSACSKHATNRPSRAPKTLPCAPNSTARTWHALAAADALMSLSGHRRQQVWDATAQHRVAGSAAGRADQRAGACCCRPRPRGRRSSATTRRSVSPLRRHPLALLRPRLARMKLMSAAELRSLPSGQTARACGIVKGRQRPQTANGTIFVTLEDETGNVNVIVWSHVDRGLARAAAQVAPARSAGHMAARRRQRRQGAAPDRHGLQGPDAAHGPARAEQHEPRLSSTREGNDRMQPIVPCPAPSSAFR